MRTKKGRPTIKDAIAFHKGGGFSVYEEDYENAEERKRSIDDFGNSIDELIRRELPKTRRLDLTLLKCHIVIEYAVNRFIEFHADNFVDITNERFTFAQKIVLLHALGLPPHPTIIPSIDLMNKLRNEVAHTMTINRDRVDRLLRINSDDYDNLIIKDDAKRTSGIKCVTNAICGYLLGASQAKAYLESEANNANRRSKPI
jgi:hypothetical protein